MDHFRKVAFTIALFTLSLNASAQSVKKEIKSAYLKTCLEKADKNYDEYEQRLYSWWCECSAEKVSDHFGLMDFIKMKYMDKKEAAKKRLSLISVLK